MYANFYTVLVVQIAKYFLRFWLFLGIWQFDFFYLDHSYFYIYNLMSLKPKIIWYIMISTERKMYF